MIASDIRASDIGDSQPEFVRIQDVQKLFGLKRGIVYRRIRDGSIKSVLLREPGNQQGVRLVYAQSIRDLLHGLMASQTVDGGGK